MSSARVELCDEVWRFECYQVYPSLWIAGFRGPEDEVSLAFAGHFRAGEAEFQDGRRFARGHSGLQTVLFDDERWRNAVSRRLQWRGRKRESWFEFSDDSKHSPHHAGLASLSAYLEVLYRRRPWVVYTARWGRIPDRSSSIREALVVMR